MNINILHHSILYINKVLRENSEILLNAMSIFINEPLLDWRNFALRQAKQQSKFLFIYLLYIYLFIYLLYSSIYLLYINIFIYLFIYYIHLFIYYIYIFIYLFIFLFILYY